MKQVDLLQLRLQNQQITTHDYKTIHELVAYMGAMQAQDYAMSKWAIGIRLHNSTDKQIEEAFNKGEILRTHLLRPTWHVISAQDIRWMLTLSAPQVKSILHSSDKRLGLTEAIHSKAKTILEKALRDHQHLTRDELIDLFQKSKINTDGNIPAHIMMRAELDGLVCSGKMKDKKQTYALLDERVKSCKAITREEALTKLVERYFRSHGPATLNDFMWWSGLSLKDSKIGMAGISALFQHEIIDGETYWYMPSSMDKKATSPHVCLLPAYDEFIISYKNRNAILSIENQKKAFSNNGIFRPVVLVNGEGIGIWKKVLVKDKVKIESTLFKPQNKSIENLMHIHAKTFGVFLNKEAYI